jgi:hypothetical protein
MTCPYCCRPLVKIDYYGEGLIGCLECNKWGKPGDKTFVMELMEDNVAAVRASRERDLPDTDFLSTNNASARGLMGISRERHS